MHLTINRLLSIRDSEPNEVAHLEHLRGCAECSQTLAVLRLQKESLCGLKKMDPPVEAWNKIVQELDRPVKQRRFTAVTAIASLVGLAVVSISIVNLQSSQPVQSMQAKKEHVDERFSEATAEWVAKSQELEQVLHQLPNRPYVQRAGTAAAIDDLETSIQLVDAQLSSPEVGISNTQSEQLWRQRVELMTSLVNVRYAQASRFYL